MELWEGLGVAIAIAVGLACLVAFFRSGAFRLFALSLAAGVAATFVVSEIVWTLVRGLDLATIWSGRRAADFGMSAMVALIAGGLALLQRRFMGDGNRHAATVYACVGAILLVLSIIGAAAGIRLQRDPDAEIMIWASTCFAAALLAAIPLLRAAFGAGRTARRSNSGAIEPWNVR